MATKKITELSKVASVQDADLIIVETENGTKSISKENFLTNIRSLIFLDSVTGNEYIVSVQNGELKVQTMEEILVDFEYTKNEDGTYTITDWKGTYNGEDSTKLVIPAYSKIIL